MRIAGMTSEARLLDQAVAKVRRLRGQTDHLAIVGFGFYRLIGEDGGVKQTGVFANLITEVGDEYYGERAAGIASPPNQVTGMRYGTGITAVAKTGAGAAIVTYVAGSSLAIDAGFPTSALSGSSRRIQWRRTWAAGVATANGISEAVITIETPLTDVAGTAANTISRALLSPVVNKGASDSLEVTWNHDLLGA
jgi:hypothetical protein